MKKYMVLAVVAALLGGGCIFPQSGTPQKIVNYLPELSGNGETFNLRTGAVTNVSGAGREFLRRSAGSVVQAIPGTRWLNSPDVMLKSAMLTAYNGGSNAISVSAQILRFEFSADLKRLDAVIVFSAASGKTVVCAESEPVGDEDYGKALSRLFNRVIAKAAKEVAK